MPRIIERVNEYIPSWFRRNKATAKVLAGVYSLSARVGGRFGKQLQSAVRMYRDKTVDPSALRKDMIKEFVRAWVRPVEYAKFDLFSKSIAQRDTYIADHETVYILKFTKGHNILPDNKFERYEMFKKYYKRDVICVSDENCVSPKEYESFISGKQTVVVKPVKGTHGNGVTLVKTDNIKTLSDFKSAYKGDRIIEQTIQQGDELRQFHPSSVNTVRFVTGIDKSGCFHHLFSLVRMGHGGSVIDNVSGGGLVVLVDMTSGKISSGAYQGTAKFDRHPDTNVPFSGVQIPMWSELCSLVKQIHLEHKGQMVFGFDMAWTDKGWDLVEVNPAPSLDSYQELTGEGIRPYLKRLNMI